MQDRFEDLRTFVALAQSGGFNAAANRLGIVKSAVSRRIRELEERLQVRLVQRTTRQISLTDAGRAYFDRAAAILASLEELDESVRNSSHQPTGTLRVSAPVSLSIHRLAAAVVRFQADHPGVKVELDANDRVVDIVQDGFDLALRVGALRDSTLIAKRIAAYRLVAVASPAYLEGRGRPSTPGDLAAHDGIFVSLRDDDGQWAFRDGVTGIPKARLKVSNADAIRAAAVAGAGIALLPSFAIDDDVASGRLESVLTGYEREPVPLHAVFPATQHVPTRVRAFIDFLVEEFGDNPPRVRKIKSSRNGTPDADG